RRTRRARPYGLQLESPGHEDERAGLDEGLVGRRARGGGEQPFGECVQDPLVAEAEAPVSDLGVGRGAVRRAGDDLGELDLERAALGEGGVEHALEVLAGATGERPA